MNMTIRRTVRSDADALSCFLAVVWHHTYDRTMGPEKVSEITARWHAPALLAGQTVQKDAVCLVAHDGDTLVGHAFASNVQPDTLALHRLYVDPVHQRGGIGKCLLDQVLKLVPGVAAVRLEVDEQNQQAVRFYQANGFSVIDRTSDCGGDSGQPALIMQRWL